MKVMVSHCFLLGCLLAACPAVAQPAFPPRLPFPEQQESLRAELAAFDLMRERFSLALSEGDLPSAEEIRTELAAQLRTGLSRLQDAWMQSAPGSIPPRESDWSPQLERFIACPLPAPGHVPQEGAVGPEDILHLLRRYWSDSIEGRPAR